LLWRVPPERTPGLTKSAIRAPEICGRQGWHSFDGS
jgi:hypothetical protein